LKQEASAQRNCPVCQTPCQAGLEPWHFVCPACKYEGTSLEPTINVQAMHDVVDEEERERGLRAIRTENFRDLISLIRPMTKPTGRKLLEVGCAHGWFLEEVGTEFQSLGIEPDDHVRAATLKKGLRVVGGYFPDALGPDDKFDVIVFNDVIEHIPSIKDALDACQARMNEGGILVLNLPNSRGFFYLLSKVLARVGWSSPFRRLWQENLPSPHVHYFAPDNLTRLVQQTGLVHEKTVELPSVRVKGLWDRLSCARNVSTVNLLVQYFGILAVAPVLRLFPSDISVGVYRKT
jgi:2-polyprenyl-3-methyl-5-hydroxy-6-metoxy-1,4-benzoquinol methylase